MPPRIPPPGTRLPVALPIALPRALPIAKPIADQLTNIDATNLAARPGDFGIPTARRLDQVNPDPLWISRWQDSATPLGKPRPWVTGYRWWEANVPFRTWGPDPMYRIDFMWNNQSGMKPYGYRNIPRELWEEFARLTTSVGQWFHARILGPGWRRGNGALFPDFPL